MAAPTLIEALRQDPVVQPLLRDACEEEGIRVTLSPRLTPADVVIIKPDAYYDTVRFATPPPSPDCLVVVRCGDGTYSVFVVELKNIGSPAGFTLDNLQAKFNTCLHDFMGSVLAHHFADAPLRRVRLYFVTAPYGPGKLAHDKLARTPKLDALLALPPFRYDNRNLGIEHHLPDPAIQPC